MMRSNLFCGSGGVRTLVYTGTVNESTVCSLLIIESANLATFIVKASCFFITVLMYGSLKHLFFFEAHTNLQILYSHLLSKTNENNKCIA